MTIQALYTAATGMNSLQTKLDVTSNNLANVNTTAYKRARTDFQDLYYRNIKLPGYQDQAGNLTPTGIAIGMGTRVSATQTDFSQGAFNETGAPLDLAINGNGLFQIQDPSGQIYFTRSGNFSVNANGQVVTSSALDGRPLTPPITIQQDATGIVVGADGKVQIQTFGTTNLQNAGQIQLVWFQNPEGLLKLGENLYQQTQASGPQLTNNPGQNGMGTIQQGVLEQSNVEPVTELIDLITTQRSFELNSQMVQAGDQILQLIANLRRY
jgi:flagellar basal-body rod protein FlgG